MKDMSKKFSKFNVALLCPLPNHPDKLTNHISATFLRLDTTKNEDVISTLNTCHQSVVQATKATFSFLLVPIFLRVASFNLAFLVSRLTHVRHVSAGITSFPGPSEPMFYNGRKILTSHFAAECASGVLGLAFQALSYDNQIRLVVVAENALMDRHQLKNFMGWICEEIDRMYEKAIKFYKENGNVSTYINKEREKLS